MAWRTATYIAPDLDAALAATPSTFGTLGTGAVVRCTVDASTGQALVAATGEDTSWNPWDAPTGYRCIEATGPYRSALGARAAAAEAGGKGAVCESAPQHGATATRKTELRGVVDPTKPGVDDGPNDGGKR